MKRKIARYLIPILVAAILCLVPVNAVFAASGSVVASTTDTAASGSEYQFHSFYYNGLHWVWYSNGTNIVYKYSSDGSSWSAAQTVRAVYGGQGFSIYFDNTNNTVSYAAVPTVGFGNSIVYRRGVPNADGSITWAAAEQTVATAGGAQMYNQPFIVVDSTANPWISYTYFNGADNDIYIIEDTNNDGTWATASNNLLTADNFAYNPYALQMTAGKLMAIWQENAALPCDIKYRTYNGAAWAAEATIEASVTQGQTTAVDNGDDIHLIYWDINNLEIRHRVYTAGAWGAANTVATKSDRWARICNLGGGELMAFYMTEEQDHVYYKPYTAGAWGSETDWLDETTDTITSEAYGNCFLDELTGISGFMYMTKASSPYDLKYAFLEATVAPTIATQTASAVTTTTARLNATLTDDGGEACDVAFGWDTVSRSCIIANYANTCNSTGTYTTGQHPYCDLGSLTCNITYYFCSEATNSAGVGTGGELSFTTSSCAVSANATTTPSFFNGMPEDDSISLTWVRPEGSVYTMVRHSKGCGASCAVTSNTTGTLTYNGTLSYYELTGLDHSTNYCFYAFNNGNSTSNATLCVTTLPSEDIGEAVTTNPTQPSRWTDAPDYTTQQGNNPLYDTTNMIADYYQSQRGYFWSIMAVVISILAGILVYAFFTNGWAMLITIVLMLTIAWSQHIVPAWLPAVTAITGFALFAYRARGADS